MLTFTWLLSAGAWLPRPPLGLDLYMPVPETNVLTREKALLGRKLFFDRRLSRDGTLSCSSCHDPQRAFSDGRPVARGIHDAEGTRNSPALINRGYGRAFFWDGRASSLERQALEPILNPIELGLTEAELERRTGMKAGNVTAALASYVRTIRSGDSRYDRYAAGKSGALSDLEKTGLSLFRGKGQCSACHIGPTFTDEQFHNTGVAWREDRFTDEGRYRVSATSRDHGAFKTPTLREIARTAPYMHDGSLTTLEDVVDFYSEGGRQNPALDSEIRPRNFTSAEKQALVAFLRSLNGQIQEGWR
jgi:cytochrome c peroxidase